MSDSPRSTNLGSLPEHSTTIKIEASSSNTISYITKKRKTSTNCDEKDGPSHKTRKTFIEDDKNWAADGNLLLQIDDIRFKVHLSRLARESSWFDCLNRRRAGQSTIEYEDWELEQVDSILHEKEEVDGVDLFFLNFGESSAEEFSALLTAMDSAMYTVFFFARVACTDTVRQRLCYSSAGYQYGGFDL